MALYPQRCRCCDETSTFTVAGKEYKGFTAAKEAETEIRKKALESGEAIVMVKDGTSQVVYLKEQQCDYDKNSRIDFLKSKGWVIKEQL